MATLPDSTPTSVYRYYDSAGVLIYVGITSAAGLRNKQHNNDKEWWPWVASQQVDHRPSREAARAHEAELIQKFRPPFNVHHNSDHAAIRRAYIAARVTGVYDLVTIAALPPELRCFDVDVARIDPTLGKAELRTRAEHAPAAIRLHYTGRVQVSNARGRKIGEVAAIHKTGPIAVFTLALNRGWTFTSVRIWIRPIRQKGTPMQYELKQVIASDADTVSWRS